jgi:hypothetical protein
MRILKQLDPSVQGLLQSNKLKNSMQTILDEDDDGTSNAGMLNAPSLKSPPVEPSNTLQSTEQADPVVTFGFEQPKRPMHFSTHVPQNTQEKIKTARERMAEILHEAGGRDLTQEEQREYDELDAIQRAKHFATPFTTPVPNGIAAPKPSLFTTLDPSSMATASLSTQAKPMARRKGGVQYYGVGFGRKPTSLLKSLRPERVLPPTSITPAITKILGPEEPRQLLLDQVMDQDEPESMLSSVAQLIQKAVQQQPEVCLFILPTHHVF